MGDPGAGWEFRRARLSPWPGCASSGERRAGEEPCPSPACLQEWCESHLGLAEGYSGVPILAVAERVSEEEIRGLEEIRCQTLPLIYLLED